MTAPRDGPGDIQLLIFDLDGTLIDSKKDLVLAVNVMREQMGLPVLPDVTVSSYVGHGVVSLMQKALGAGAADDAVERGLGIFLDYYRLHLLDNTVTYPGVREALAELRERRLAVLSNKPVGFSRQILTGLGIANYFSSIYGGDSFEQKKPDPVGIVKLINETGLSPQRTMMVGDSDTDVLTGRNAGVWTCGVTYGFGSHTLEAAPPDWLVDDLRSLVGLLNGIQRRGLET